MRYGDAVLGTMYDIVFGRKDPLCQESKSGKEQANMVVHVELNAWAQAEEHFRALDQDQGREHYDRDMFNCELALNILGIGTLFSCRGHLDGLAAFPYITVVPQRAVAGLVPRYVSMMETLPLSQEALAVKSAIVHAMSELGQQLLSLLTGFYEERQTPLPCRLVIQSNGLGSYTLVNQGAIVGLLSDQEALRTYQDEFMAFGEYLKSIWG
jgi:hypothetical protein